MHNHQKTKRPHIQTGETWIGLDVCESRLLLSNTMLDYFPIATGNTWTYEGDVNGGEGTVKLTSASGGLVNGVATTLFTLAVKDSGGTATAKLFVTNTVDGLELHRLQLIDDVTSTYNFASPVLLSGPAFEPSDLLTSDIIDVTGTQTGDGATPAFSGFVSHQTSFLEETTVVSTLGEISAFPVEISFFFDISADDDSWSSTIDFSLNFYLAPFAGPVGVDVFYEELIEETGFPSELITLTAEQIVTSSALLKPRVSIEAVAPTGEEGGDSPTLRITRQSALPIDQPLTVSLTRSGTAKFGATADYTLTDGSGNPLTSTVIIPANQDSVDVHVNILDDQLAEVDETVVLTIASNSAYAINALAKTATATIEDNEPRISIETLSDSGEGEDSGVFRIRRTTSTGITNFSFTRGGTASFGPTGDYTLTKGGVNLTTTLVEIPDGEDHVDIVVVPVNDSLAEVTETVTLTLKAGTGYSIDPQETVAIMEIEDNEPIISIEKIDDAGEGAELGKFRISRDQTDGDVIVKFTRSGTAKFGPTGDYTLSIDGVPLTTTTFVIPDGEDHVDITVTPVDDTLAEPTETVILTLAGTPQYTADPQSKTATVEIEDNEPIVGITKLDDTGEGEEPAKFRITRDTTQGALIVNFTRSGAAKFGPAGDYTLSVGGQDLAATFITIPDGETHVDVTVNPVNDLIAEIDETVMLTLKSSKAYTLEGDAKSAQMTVTDDEPTVSIEALEDTGEGDEPGVFRISRDGTSGALAVNFTRTGTAKFGPAGDYTLSVDGVALLGTVVTIPDGEDHVDITVTPVNDVIAEVTETVILTLKSANTYKLDDEHKVATVEIADDEPVVSIEKISNTQEGSDPGVFRISRTTNAGDMAVNFARSGTAKFGATGDYTLFVDGVNITGTTVTIPDGEDHVDVEVHAVDDTAAELAESVILTLAPLATYTVDAGAKSATAFIQDNEVRTLSINDVTITEGQSGQKQAKFTVTLSAASSSVISVDYSTVSGDVNPEAIGGDEATPSEDFEEIAGDTLVFAPGQTKATVIVNINGDIDPELNEKFSVVLENASGATILDGIGIGTIKNDDVVDLAVTALTFSRTTFTEFEDSGSLQITITVKNQGTVDIEDVVIDIGLTADPEFVEFLITQFIASVIEAGETITRKITLNLQEEPFFTVAGSYFRIATIVSATPAELGDGDDPSDLNNKIVSSSKDVKVNPEPEPEF